MTPPKFDQLNPCNQRDRRRSVPNAEKFTTMLKERLKHCRFSGLTDIRTVSDELSSDNDGSGFFSAATDQTMTITDYDQQELAEFKNPLDEHIVDEINNFVATNVR